MKYIQDSSYVRRAPSDVAIASEFRRLQNNDEGRILNDRPHKDVQITPIALLYPPFGKFLDHIRNPPMDSDDIDLAYLEAAVNEFSSLMCQHHDKEDERRDGVLMALSLIFECYLPSQLTSMTPFLFSGDRCSNGRVNGPAGVLETIAEFENEFGSGETDPEVKITAYYAQSVAKASCWPHNALCDRFLFPALGISLVGKDHKTRLFFGTLAVISHTLSLLFFRFVYWIQRPCISRQTQIRRTHTAALGSLSLWR
jgi:hypothetical protein